MRNAIDSALTSTAAGAKSLIEGAPGGFSYGRLLANIASVFILGLGIIAALNQVGIATAVTTPVLVAVLATIAGILVVGVGGGLIKPMQHRWENYLSTAEAEAPKLRAQAQSGARTTPAGTQPAGSRSATVALPTDGATARTTRP